MRKGIKVVTGMLAGLFILGAGMQVEAGFNLGKAFGNVGVKANVPAAKDSVPTVGNSGVGMTAPLVICLMPIYTAAQPCVSG